MTFENINDAIQAIYRMSRYIGEPVYYRGQHHDWNITSSSHRLWIQGNRKLWEEEMLKTKSFIDWLKTRREETNLFRNIRPSVGDLPYWAIAQHYGYKTDFIDFTTDIEIAKAFALIGKERNEMGFIFCLWKKDVDLIIETYRSYADQLPSVSQEILKSVDYCPFFHFELPEISRITNQKGLFLWDANSIATQLFDGLIDQYISDWMEMHIFRFQQTDLSVGTDVLRRVYPFPNITELEIDHFVQRYNHDCFYKNTSVPIFPRVEIDLSDRFASNTWNFSHAFEVDPEEHYPSDKQASKVVSLHREEIKKLTVNPDECIAFIIKWRQELKQNRFIMYVSENKDSCILFTEIINEVLSSLSIYINLNADVLGIILSQALQLLNMMLILCKMGSPDWFTQINDDLKNYHYDLTDSNNNLEKYLDILRQSIPLEKAVQQAWGYECIFIRMENNTGNNTTGVLPKIFIGREDKREYMEKNLQILRELYDQALIPPTVINYEKRELKRVLVDKNDISWELMFDVVRDPKVLFNQEDAFYFFVNYFIPWQIVISPQKNRIYNPFEIKSMRRLDVDNMVEKYPIFYYKGGFYVYLDDETIYTEDIYIMD